MRRALVLAGLLLAAGSAMAQQPRVELAPSEALRCLSPPAAQRGAPDYPFEAYKRGDAGRVHARLTFTAAAQGPALLVLAQEGDSSFVDAVRAHVQSLRVPCLAAGAPPAVLDIDYVFRKDDRSVHWHQPVDADVAERTRQLACLRLPEPPSYPDAALRAAMQATVLVQMRFDAADQPPTMQVHPRADPGALADKRRMLERFAQSVEKSARDIRVPCHSGAPLDLVMTYNFRIEGAGLQGFKPGLTLPSLLPAVRGISKQRLAFDTGRMGCPFDVAMAYRRPHLPNAVAELGSADPARRTLLDWLAQVEFDLPAAMLDAIYGDTATITVPCLKIDLNPTGVTS
jgi:hypothetical protein